MSADPYIGREILGQFRILERIGTGGMGSVYKAEQPAMDRLVAVKILHPKLAVRRDLVSRFRREARAMSHLTHPNTVRVFLYGQLDDGSLYIVMEFLEGKNLAQVVRAEGPMEPKRAVSVVIQACGALEEAHRQGIIHRDLKPENIFLTRPGGIEDFAKVLDFGLAKVTQREMRPGSLILTQEGMVFGTPEFMSPEQAQGKTLDPRADIYSLGIILYELVTGKLPFDAKVPMEFINLHVSATPIPLAERSPGRPFPPDLQRVLDRSMEKDPENRYQTAAEFAVALKGIFTEKGLTGAMRAVPPSGIAPTRPAMQQPAEAKADAPAHSTTSEPVSLPQRKMGSTLLLVLGGLLVFAASFALFASVAGEDAPDAGPPVFPATGIAPVTAVPAQTAAPAPSVPATPTQAPTVPSGSAGPARGARAVPCPAPVDGFVQASLRGCARQLTEARPFHVSYQVGDGGTIAGARFAGLAGQDPFRRCALDGLLNMRPIGAPGPCSGSVRFPPR